MSTSVQPPEPLPGPRDPAADLRTARALVAAQFALLGVLVLLPRGHDWVVSPGMARVGFGVQIVALSAMVLAATSLGRGLTAVPLPNARARLRTGGLYRFVRHPIYSGLLTFAAAQAVCSGSWIRLAAALGLAGLLSVKARWEERRLMERFEGYQAYARMTPRFVPWFGWLRRR